MEKILPKFFNQSKIVLNIHFPQDIPFRTNIRTFETTGCGSFLLTDNTIDLHTFFKNEK